MKKTPHPLPHIFEDDSCYAIIGTLENDHPFLASNKNKTILLKHIHKATKEFSYQLSAWVILDNHYHLLIKISDSGKMSHFVRKVHGPTAYEINKFDKKRGRQIFHNYWDTLIHSDKDFWTRFNYIHHNPVKHGYVNNMKEWEFSSYAQYVEEKGKKWMARVLRDYPIVDFRDSAEISNKPG